MSEESPENFNSGDVVWVKLGSSWWPGEVKDAEELPNDILDFKKPPLAIVKFFDEDSYEYVKSWANIYPYNCEKKNEFIKKGMAAFRAKVPHMDKFPKDVLTAESKVGGNPNILSDPMFLPDKKKNYAAEIFGTPSPKVKTNKDKRRSNTKSSQKNAAHITHRRFLGVDDYRAYICIQYPGKDRIPGDKEDEEVLRINREPEQEFNCHTCSFTTKRLEVMILHTKSHIQGVYVSSPRKNKQSAVRKKKEKTKKSRNVDDVIESESSSSDTEPVRERKRKPKSQSAKEPKVKKTGEKETLNQSIDIRNELLAVWDDSNDDDDDEFDISLDKLGKSQKLSQSTLEGVLSGTIVESADESLSQSFDDTRNKSEALGEMVEETLEQIRAEVINPSDPAEMINQSENSNRSIDQILTKSVEEVLNESAGELLNQSEILNQMNRSIEESSKQSMPLDPSAEVPKEPTNEMLKESTDEVPKDAADQLANNKFPDNSSVEEEIVTDKSEPDSDADNKETEKVEKKMDRDIQEAIKSCFDFDEDDEEDNAIVSKATIGGRKIPRVIPLTERRKSKDIIEDDVSRRATLKDSGRKEAGEGSSEEVDAAFKELMEMTTVPELPEVQNTLKCEQNFHNIKTIKFPDKPEPVGSPPKVTKTEKKDSSEVATKLTNPKKRFVKSFEDFELMQNEIRRKEERGELARSEDIESRMDSLAEKSYTASSSVFCSNYDDYDSSGSPQDPAIELSKLKSKIMSKIIEEANINEESKSKIMSKIQEPKVESAESKPPSYTEDRKPEKVYSSVSHRTPRSKILESYMKDTNNQKAEEQKKEKIEQQSLEVSQPNKNIGSNNREEIDGDKTKEVIIRKDVVPPKKSKWSRRGSHPKKDRNLFLLEDIRLDDYPTKENRKEDKPEESIQLDTQETLAILDTSSKAPNDSVVEEFVPFSTNNEVILQKDVLINEETHLDESSSKLPSIDTESEEILPRQEDDIEVVLSKNHETDKMTSIVEETDRGSTLKDVEMEKLHLNDNETETDRICLNDEEAEKLPAEDQQINILSPEGEETEKLLSTFEEIVEASSKDEEIEMSPLKDEEIQKSPLKDVEIEKSSLKDEETENSSLKDGEIEKLSSKDGETEKSSLKDEEIEKSPLKDGELEKLSLKDEEIERTSLKDGEIEQSSLKDEETEKLRSKDKEIDEASSEDKKTETPLVMEETINLLSKSEETVELSPKEGESEKILENEVSEKSTKDEEINRLELDHQETEKTLTNEKESDTLLKEADHLPVGENEIDSLLLNEKDSHNLIENEEKAESIIDKEQEVITVEDTLKLNTSDYNSDKKESVTIENAAPLINNVILDQDSCVLPSYQSATSTPESDELNSGLVLGDKKLSLPVEESPSLSPGREVFAPMDNTTLVSPKKSISSPPKKSKKRKMLEINDALDTTKSETTKLEVENFSPSEKRKKDADLKDEDTAVVSEKSNQLSDLEPTGCYKEVVDNGTEIKEPDVKTSVTPEKDEETTYSVTTEATDHTKEVEIQCASSSVESFKFSIQTNLTNLTSREEMSALALATLSEIKADLENSDSGLSEIREDQPEIKVEPERSVVLPIPVQSELVPIEGNLTVVSEKDLADGQVEITTEKVISPKKPVTLSNFSMDFSDSGSDSNSNSTNDAVGDSGKSVEFTSKGTEFTSKAMTKQIKKLNKKKENTYERLELLNILEGNSDSEKKPKEYQQLPKKTVMEDICDFEEHIPSQIVCAKGLKRGMIDTEGDFIVKEKSQKMSEKSTASKLLERLTESKTKATPTKTSTHSEIKLEGIGKFSTKTTPSTTKQTKYVVKSKTPMSTNKPIILSEQIIKPASEAKSKTKRMLNDIEDVEAFVIHKDPKKNKPDEEIDISKSKSASKSAGKAKILQQTIITPAGEIIQPTVNQAQADDNIFDINSMPIVLSDEILTPESIENMPIVIGTEAKSADHEKLSRRPTQGRIITKTTVTTTPQAILNKTHTITKHSKPPRILQTVGSKIIKNSPLLPNTAKPGKYIIVPQSGIPQNKLISKKAPVVKRSPVTTGILTKVPNIAPEPSGNKIMIVTNQQGQQQRLLLTPAQQKMLGYQNQKVTKTVMKGNMLQKSVLATKSVPLVEAGTSGIISKNPSIIGQKVMLGTNSSPGLITTTSHQVISNQGRSIKSITKRVPSASQKVFSNSTKQKTILIKNQHGQTVRKIQGTDDELLDKQVAEQLEAIKASSGMKFSSQPKQTETYKVTPKSTVRRSYSKKIEVKPKLGPPPLTGVQQSPKSDKLATLTFPAAKKTDPVEVKPTPPLVPEETKADRPLNQLVIQDAVGNQTTITEGQILALPSETVDGQPQSYMLVTLDESGNLTPLNSEALMSLDPNLGLGGDLSNMVLQIDQGALTERPQTIPIKTSGANELAKTVMVESTTAVPVPEASVTTEISESPVVEQKIDPIMEMPQAIVPSTNGDPGQQLIVTGDPIATQKFLESLTEGTTDLANILANADGNSILIQADGQQILINTNSDNQMLLSMNNDSINVSESTEGGGNPIFATQPNKNQDILAAALADTDVFQQEQHSTQGKITSQLSPNNTLYPMNVGNVLETSLTLSSPIMTPLEVPSTNNKKIPDDEADILTQVPKNVDLPITITDPNISQTVANQQVASLIANELQTNLELTLPISETTISAVSTEMNSPSFVYSLPTLDDSVDITQKPFNSSMPLLNEDVEDSNTTSKIKTDEDGKLGNENSHTSVNSSSSAKPHGVVNSEGCFLEEEEGRFTLGGEMCSSLSEPPPEMFDLPESTSDVSDNTSKEDDTTDLSTQADTSSEGSCEIPLQPQIVTKSLDLSQNLDSLKRSLEESKGQSKKCKFD